MKKYIFSKIVQSEIKLIFHQISLFISGNISQLNETTIFNWTSETKKIKQQTTTTAATNGFSSSLKKQCKLCKLKQKYKTNSYT